MKQKVQFIEKSNILESSLVHESSQHVVVTRRATTPAASLTRVATPSLKSSIMKAIKGSSIFEQDQIEAALRCVMRVSGTSQYFEILMSLLSNASPAASSWEAPNLPEPESEPVSDPDSDSQSN